MKTLIDSPILKKLPLQAVVEAIKKAIQQGRPIYIRHHCDADGFSAGVAMERALLTLLGQKHSRARDISNYYSRIAIQTPFYGYQDATKDVNSFMRFKETYGNKEPLILLLDLGSGQSSVQGIQKVKLYGASVIIVDHHPPVPAIDKHVAVHINPHLVGSTYDYCAGMLCAEIGHVLLESRSSNLHLDFIAAVSGYADRVASKEFEKYVALCKKQDLSIDFIARVAKALDYETIALGPANGRSIMQDILTPGARQKKLLVVIEKDMQQRLKTQLTSTLHFADVEEKKNFLFVKVPITEAKHRGDYPRRGKSISLILDHYVAKGNKVLAIGYGSGSINFRCSTQIKKFDVHHIIEGCQKKFPYAQVQGGGHRVAGTIRFVPGAMDDILDFINEYADTL